MLAALTIIFSAWLLHFSTELVSTIHQRDSRVPEYTLTNIVLTATEPSGAPQYRIKAMSMAHFSDDNTSELEQPHFWFYRDAERPLKAKSERAWISGAGDEILLLGKVDIVQPKTQMHRPFTVETRDLRVFPDKRVGITASPIKADSGRYHLQGVGGDINLLDGSVRIHSEVSSVYEP